MIRFVIFLIFPVVFSGTGWDDSVLFKLDWDKPQLDPPPAEKMTVISSDSEKFTCYLPDLEKTQADNPLEYDGPTPIELLRPLFQQSMCTFRLESYWTYEVCHGRYIRQFHEEKLKTQEYFLGNWEAIQGEIESSETKKIYGTQLPYFEIQLGGGSVCDLNLKPRTTKLLYVCVSNIKQHEVYSLKEISSCEYEVIVLTPLLCSHPKYKPKQVEENVINCVAENEEFKKPRSLLQMELDSLKLRQQNRINEGKSKKVYAVFKVDKDSQGVRVELRPFDELETSPAPTSLIDTSPVESFLMGKNCLNGGSGWWKYDFCYGRHIEQYHIDPSNRRIALILGKFNLEEHLKWLQLNPHKRPKLSSQRKQLSHFYSDGSICDKTGKPRQTEVKLKCLENAASQNAVQLYLLEPKFCEYILGVESPIICEILDYADEDGMIDLEKWKRENK